MEDQQKLWDKIAKEWHEFKTSKRKKDQRVIDFLKKQKGQVLDLGSGSGRYMENIKDGKMHLVDISKQMLYLEKKEAKERGIKGEYVVSEINKIPFRDEFFDAAISISSLHCIKGEKKRKQVLQELYRTLKKGGEAIIAVWNKEAHRFKNAKKEKYVGWRDLGKRYYYLYHADELKEQLENVGFSIKKEMEHRLMILFLIKKG